MRCSLWNLVTMGMLASCALPKKTEEREVAPETRPRLVGRIAAVPAGMGFVLVESYGPWRVPEGGLLSGLGEEGRSSSLIVTGERLGRHLAADVRSGEVVVGDSVYYRPVKDPEVLEDNETNSGPTLPGAGEEGDDSQKAEIEESRGV